MLAAYALLDCWLADGTDLFAPGNSRCWLELNARVLGGGEPAWLRASEERFYDETLGGIRDVNGWYERHRGDGVWKRAAGVYVRIVSEPQLFLEGNHRCGILIASWLLGVAGEPPVVMGRDAASQFFQLSSLIQQTPKHSFSMLFRLPAFRRRLAQLFRQSARVAYLR